MTSLSDVDSAVVYLSHQSPHPPLLLPLHSSPRTGICLRLTSLGVAQKLAFHLGGGSRLLATLHPFCKQYIRCIRLAHEDCLLYAQVQMVIKSFLVCIKCCRHPPIWRFCTIFRRVSQTAWGCANVCLFVFDWGGGG